MTSPALSAPIRRFLTFWLAAWLIAAASAAIAQDSPAPTGPQAVRELLERTRSQFDQSDATLQRPDLRDAALQQLRAGLDPPMEALRGLVEEIAPRVDGLKARVAQLGPKPDASKGQQESPELARERADRERILKEHEDTLTLARALLGQGEALVATIADRRRSQFAQQLFQRSFSPLNPELWLNVARAAPRDVAALSITLSDWGRVVSGARGPGQWLALLLGIFAAFVVLAPLTRFVERYAMRGDAAAKPARGEKAFRAAIIATLGTARPVVAAWILGSALEFSGLVPARILPAVMMALVAYAAVAAVAAVGQAILAPDAPNWRLPNLSDANAGILKTTAMHAAAVHMTGKVVETIGQSIGAGLPLAIATRAVFALIFAAVLWRALQAARPDEPGEEECLGPYVAPAVSLAGPLRLGLAAALAIVVAAALTGYVALAAFVIDQLIWIGFVGAGLGLLLIIVDDYLPALLAPESRATRMLNENVGLRTRSIQQLAVVATGLIKLFLWFTALMLIIAPWGVQSNDIFSSLRSLLFGVRVGDVTISFSAIVGAIVVLAAGVFLTRSAQRWLDDKLLPRTDLDPGIKNSIRTAVGYAGVVLAAALAVSSLGLSLDRIAIIAGALSVGIGFGLQSVVNNFVSGLILLWERPIRVGDLIDVGGDQGVVRRINVRSTEIETFDRATVIMPNSNLVSGVVKNRVHSDRTGRVLISLSVPRASNPDIVADVLTQAAEAHSDVMRAPPPRVVFKKIGDGALEFDLICFVPDVDLTSRVSSDLHFAIFRELGRSLLPAGTTKVEVAGMDRIEDTLEDIADAIEERDDGRPARKTPPGKAKPPGA